MVSFVSFSSPFTLTAQSSGPPGPISNLAIFGSTATSITLTFTPPDTFNGYTYNVDLTTNVTTPPPTNLRFLSADATSLTMHWTQDGIPPFAFSVWTYKQGDPAFINQPVTPTQNADGSWQVTVGSLTNGDYKCDIQSWSQAGGWSATFSHAGFPFNDGTFNPNAVFAYVGTRNGSATSLTKVFGTADPNHAINILYMGDGFAASEQAAYNNVVAGFVNSITTFPPYSLHTDKLNIYRLNCVSNVSGLNFGTPNNYFGSFLVTDPQSGSPDLTISDTALAPITASTWLPQYSAAAVVMNSNIDVGGSNGQAVYFSAFVSNGDAGAHEFGHLIFDLSDEYGNPQSQGLGGNTYTSNNAPTSPMGHTAINTSNYLFKAKSALPWGDMIPGTVPLLVNQDCTTFSQANTLGNAIGAFESAQYYNCGLYRGQYACKMRFAPGNPMCAICTRHMEAVFTTI